MSERDTIRVDKFEICDTHRYIYIIMYIDLCEAARAHIKI